MEFITVKENSFDSMKDDILEKVNGILNEKKAELTNYEELKPVVPNVLPELNFTLSLNNLGGFADSSYN